MKNLLLLSGGIESLALAYGLKPDLCVTVDYGQPAINGEIRAAREICKVLSLSHEVIQSNCYERHSERKLNDSFWPFRNQLLLSIALARSGDFGFDQIILGLVRDDIYLDCKVEFIRKFNELLLSQQAKVLVAAPCIDKSTVQMLAQYQVPYELLGISISCHFCSIPCGSCPGCLKSAKVKESYKKAMRLRIVSSES